MNPEFTMLFRKMIAYHSNLVIWCTGWEIKDGLGYQSKAAGKHFFLNNCAIKSVPIPSTNPGCNCELWSKDQASTVGKTE